MILFTPQQFDEHVAATPWFKPLPIACAQCRRYCNLWQEAEIQLHGTWLCREHFEKEVTR